MAILSSWIAGSGSGRASRKQEMTSALLDVGCGTGAFSIGAALRGYRALGLSWDERNQLAAKERATYCKASSAQFEVLDIRELDRRADLVNSFDVVIC
jgi:cyclopropane fatty-acyl-phospholipid synthase-like methyltransferase